MKKLLFSILALFIFFPSSVFAVTNGYVDPNASAVFDCPVGGYAFIAYSLIDLTQSFMTRACSDSGANVWNAYHNFDNGTWYSLVSDNGICSGMDYSQCLADSHTIANGQFTTILPTPTPTSVSSPTDTPTPTSALTPTPTSASSPTDSPAPTSGAAANIGGPSSPTVCPTVSYVTPAIIESRRVSPTSIFISWGPDGGLNNFYVQYGFTNGNWQYSTKVSGFSTTINNLPQNQAVWIQVAATDNCTVGTYGGAVLVGGTTATNSPGFPNTGNPLVPGLPNTGIGPDEHNNPWTIQTGIDFILSIFFKAFNFKP